MMRLESAPPATPQWEEGRPSAASVRVIVVAPTVDVPCRKPLLLDCSDDEVEPGVRAPRRVVPVKP